MNKMSLSLKTLATCVILTLLLGYLVAFLQIFDRSKMDIQHTIQYYRGDGLGDESILLPQTFSTLLSVTHVHSFSQPFIFGSLGFIFAFSSLTEKKKAFLIAIGFIGTVISNATPWLIRYTIPQTVYLFGVSQTMMSGSLLIMSWVSLKEIWRK